MKRTFLLACFAVCLTLAARAAAPWAQTMPFTPLHKFETLRIANGDAPTLQSVTFPALPKRPGARVVLRFQARLHNDTPGGWNYYCGIRLNDQQVHGFTSGGTPRLLNRGPEVTLDEGRPYTWPWWNRVQDFQISLLTWMGPGGEQLDARIKSDRSELYWHVIDIDDLIHFKQMGLDDMVVSDTPNTLVFTNSLVKGLVKGAEFDLVIEDLAVGVISDAVWKSRVARFAAEVRPLADAVAVQGEGYTVRVGGCGAVHVERDGQVFAWTSAYSYPGPKIGHNALDPQPSPTQHSEWRPAVQRAEGRITVTAQCPAYELVREVVLDGPRVRLRETVSNRTDRPLGVQVEHAVTAPAAFKQTLLGGVPVLSAVEFPENPTVHLAAEKAVLGVLAEDNISRLQLAASARPNQVTLKLDHFGLAPRASYTFEWTLYSLPSSDDYWAFINRVRRDWNTNFTLQGPWDFFNVQEKAALLRDRDRLRAYLQRKNLKIVALSPWIDYENYDQETGGLVTREKYKRLVMEAAAAFRAVDPTIKVTGSMESFPISLSLEDSRTLRDRLPSNHQKAGYPQVTREMVKGLGGLTARDQDALLVSPEGHLAVELYYRGRSAADGEPVPMVAFIAYPAIGNAQHDRLMEQARFIKEECGLDGIYIDCFSLAYEGNYSHMRYDYSKWDGLTVDTDPATGRVTRTYTDAALAGATSRAALIRYVLQNDGVFVANSYAAVKETQSLPAFRFSESEYCFNPLVRAPGETPPLFYRMCGSHLASPLALGYRPVRLRPNDAANYAQILTGAAITYLRHGALMYHYTSEIPETGPGGGEYGPWNAMFPLTPVRLGEGFLVGKERIVSAVSGTFDWPNEKAPRVLRFDRNGRPVPPAPDAPALERTPAGWRVPLRLKDWEEIAVITATE